MQTSIMNLQIVIMGIYLANNFQSVLPQTCDFVDETVPVKQPDGRIVCECDRSKGYIGPTEYACSFVECLNHMLPDDDATCQCIDDFFKRDGQCIEKSRCKADETILHNGSRYDDRKCGKNVPVNIRHPPLVVISDVKSTSASLEVFRNANETGVQTVTFIFKDLKEDLQQQRVIETKIGETELKVSAIITGLASNTSYRVEVLTSDQGGTSDPVIFVLQTELPIVRLRAAPFVKVIEKDQVSCTLEVTPDKELDSGKIALTFRNLTDNTEGHMEKDIEKGKTVTLLKVTGLTANTSYQIDVKTDDVSGLSESRQFQVQTDANRKPEMQNDEENSSLLIVVGVITLAGVCILVAAVFIIKWRKSRRTPIQETGADSPADRPTTNLLEDGLRAEASVVIPLGEVNAEAIASEETPLKEVDDEARRPQKPMTPIQENTAAADSPADRPTTNLLEKRLQAEASVVIPLGEINAEARRPQEPMTPIQETADSPADRPTTNLLEKGLQAIASEETPVKEVDAEEPIVCQPESQIQ
ncbi:uncharacterized protein LOC110462748 isoform X2 [Mizuhopecten yessoensis]|uniref:uncharacterized protein LOC110462748 isoform X2 n=1 Tax=Mizuhopecten yessoensis TaxID=6573 RepID=UPI000B45AD15|nr:uncharacterized protein LOC110462748 isoform X2 [Mizuhopecten yessoensis]